MAEIINSGLQTSNSLIAGSYSEVESFDVCIPGGQLFIKLGAIETQCLNRPLLLPSSLLCLSQSNFQLNLILPQCSTLHTPCCQLCLSHPNPLVQGTHFLLEFDFLTQDHLNGLFGLVSIGIEGID